VLCARGADETEQDVEGFTALHWAAAMGDLACIRALVQVGANLEARDRHDTTPLHSAAGKGQVRTADQLMRVARAVSDASATKEWERCRGPMTRHTGCVKLGLTLAVQSGSAGCAQVSSSLPSDADAASKRGRPACTGQGQGGCERTSKGVASRVVHGERRARATPGDADGDNAEC
jgi:hypothetical protein